VSAPVRFRRREAPAARTRRRFFEKVTGTLEKFTPDYWRRENFLCEALDSYLPPAKKKALLRVMEIEPEDAKYWAYLKPLERGWYIDEFLAVGKSVDELDQGSMRDAAKGIGASCELLSWRKASNVFPDVKKESIDIALISDGAIKRLGSRLENALRNTRKVMKPNGRFFFVMSQEDEDILGGSMEKDFSGSSPMDKYGYEIMTSKREFGLTVGYMKKKANTLPITQRAQTPAAGGFAKPRSQRRPRPY